MSFRSLRPHLSRQWHSPLVEIDQHQQSENSVGILDLATIANFGEPLQALQWKERMFNLRTHLRFSEVSFLVRIRQWDVTLQKGRRITDVTFPWVRCKTPFSIIWVRMSPNYTSDWSELLVARYNFRHTGQNLFWGFLRKNCGPQKGFAIS